MFYTLLNKSCVNIFSRVSEFRSVNHISIYENSEWKVFKNIKLFGEISSNWPNNVLGTNGLILFK